MFEQAANAPIYPHNLDAEQGILGCFMVDAGAIDRVADSLRPEHFFIPAHQRIYEAALRVREAGKAPTPVVLRNAFETDQGLEGVGGASYLAELAASVITTINAEHYAEILLDLWQRRETINICQTALPPLADCSVDTTAAQCIEEIEAQLYRVSGTVRADSAARQIGYGLREAIEAASEAASGHSTAVKTGITDLDSKLIGLFPGQLAILAGRPGMGKTALGLCIAHNIAMTGKKALYFSLEMTQSELATRLLSRETGITYAEQRRQPTAAQVRDLYGASTRLSQLPLYIDDTGTQSIRSLMTRARRQHRQHGLDLIVVDYLQLLSGTGSRQAEANRVNEVSEITRGLKGLAKELRVPVLALSQLSRALEGRNDKRPILSDLRESGSIEQDADIVLFIYRHEEYLRKEEPQQQSGEREGDYHTRLAEHDAALQKYRNIAEVIIGKFRQGDKATVPLRFDGQRQSLEDLARADTFSDSWHREAS